MAGVKGRSGGARAGSGPKRRASAPETGPATPVYGSPEPSTEAEVPQERRDALQFLEDVVNDPKAPLKDRIRAAVAAAQYRHTKRHDGGKKDETAEKAKSRAGVSKFAPAEPPRLAVANGKRV